MKQEAFRNFRGHHNIVQEVNFIIGLIFLFLAIIFSVSKAFFNDDVFRINPIMLGFCGVLAIIAGSLKNERVVYVIDMILGFIFITSLLKL